MKYLPTEIRQMIMDQVACADTCFNEEGYYVGTFEHIVDIKSLRLSCSSFANLAQPHLYRDVWLFNTGESFNKLKAIADHPIYSQMVRKLKIFWKLFDQTLLANREKYDERAASKNPSALQSSSQCCCRPSKQQMLAGWESAHGVMVEEERLSLDIESVLGEVLPALTKLKEIEPGVAREILRNKRAMQIETGTIQKLALSTSLTHWEQGWKNEPYGGEVMLKMLRAMFRAKCQGQGLILFNCGSNIESTFLEFSSHDIDDAQSVANGLRELRLRLETVKVEDLERIIDNGLITRFVGWLSSVERLSLQTSYQNPIADLQDVLGATVLPRLNELALFRLSTSAECLISIIARHQSTLKELSIANVVLSSGTWRDIFTSMRKTTALQYCHFEENYVLRGDNSIASDTTIAIQGTDIEEELNVYALEEGPWPSKSCADLELEAYFA